jgi:hypothetical protein
MPPGCVKSGHQPGAFSCPVANSGRYLLSTLMLVAGTAKRKLFFSNDLAETAYQRSVGMARAFEGHEKEPGSATEVHPNVGTGG